MTRLLIRLFFAVSFSLMVGRPHSFAQVELGTPAAKEAEAKERKDLLERMYVSVTVTPLFYVTVKRATEIIRQYVVPAPQEGEPERRFLWQYLHDSDLVHQIAGQVGVAIYSKSLIVSTEDEDAPGLPNIDSNHFDWVAFGKKVSGSYDDRARMNLLNDRVLEDCALKAFAELELFMKTHPEFHIRRFFSDFMVFENRVKGSVPDSELSFGVVSYGEYDSLWPLINQHSGDGVTHLRVRVVLNSKSECFYPKQKSYQRWFEARAAAKTKPEEEETN